MKYFVMIAGREITVEVDGERVLVEGRELTAHLRPVPGTPLRHLVFGGASLTLAMDRVEAGRWQLLVGGSSAEVEVVDERTRHIRSLTGGGAGPPAVPHLKAPMPGLVVRVLVTPGQAVVPGQGLVVLEAMKMENELRSSTAGTVRAVPATAGQVVEKGQVLVEFEA
jgi:pyruvate carboxylase subunit B